MIYNDFEKIEQIIRQAAKEKILPKFRSLQADDIMTKSSANDFVTVADKQAEAFITKELNSLYPDVSIIGEESVFEDKSLLDVLKSNKPAFVIDPVDGTRNFKDGNNEFGVMLAYAEDGEIKAGWIYLPMFDKMLVTRKGYGTYINGVKQQIIGSNIDCSMMKGSCYGDTSHFNDKFAAITHTHCSAFVYTKFVENNLDFITHIYETTYPWDHMAGVLAVNEAGGYAKTIDDNDYTPSRTDQKLIIARNKNEFEEISKLVKSL